MVPDDAPDQRLSLYVPDHADSHSPMIFFVKNWGWNVNAYQLRHQVEDGKAYAKGNLQQAIPVDPPKGCDREMVLATRPNQIDINRESGYESVVENRIFLTDYTEYQVKVGDALVQVQAPHRIEFSVGDKCFLRFPNAMWYPVEDEAAEIERNRRQLV